MTQSASNSSLAPEVNEEGILEQVLSTHRGHETVVGLTLSQRIHQGTSSSSSHSKGSSTSVNLYVEEYMCRSYEQNLQMYESHRMMQELLAQPYPNIQLPTITRPEPYVDPSPPSPPNVGDDDASDTTNLEDN